MAGEPVAPMRSWLLFVRDSSHCSGPGAWAQPPKAEDSDTNQAITFRIKAARTRVRLGPRTEALMTRNPKPLNSQTPKLLNSETPNSETPNSELLTLNS